MSVINRMNTLLENVAMPIGTRSVWKDGEHIKTGPGEWQPVSKGAPPAGSHATYIGEPKGTLYSLERYVLPRTRKETVRATEAKAMWDGLNKVFELRFRDDTDPDIEEAKAGAAMAIREGLAQICDGAGMVNRDRVNLKLWNSFELNDDEATKAAWGLHTYAGRIKLCQDRAIECMEFLARHRARRKAPADWTAQDITGLGSTFPPRELRGMKTLVHEQIHGYSPMDSKRFYHGAGAAFEEATTELAARKLLKDAFGLNTEEFGKVVDANTLPKDTVGTYHVEVRNLIDGMVAALADIGIAAPPRFLDPAWWNEFLGAAAIKMRGDDGRGLQVESMDEAYRRFVTALPIPLETWTHLGKVQKKQPSDVEAEFYSIAEKRVKQAMEAFQPTLSAEKDFMKRELQHEAKDKGTLNPYHLKRNDLEGALRVAKGLKAKGWLTPEAMQVLHNLQDDPRKLIAALK